MFYTFNCTTNCQHEKNQLQFATSIDFHLHGNKHFAIPYVVQGLSFWHLVKLQLLLLACLTKHHNYQLPFLGPSHDDELASNSKPIS